jgi:hypothetical protein
MHMRWAAVRQLECRVAVAVLHIACVFCTFLRLHDLIAASTSLASSPLFQMMSTSSLSCFRFRSCRTKHHQAQGDIYTRHKEDEYLVQSTEEAVARVG